MSNGPMSEGNATRLDKFAAPWGREIELEEVAYGDGMRMMRVRIREGRRFTVLEIDPAAAAHWGAAMTEWAARHAPD